MGHSLKVMGAYSQLDQYYDKAGEVERWIYTENGQHAPVERALL